MRIVPLSVPKGPAYGGIRLRLRAVISLSAGTLAPLGAPNVFSWGAAASPASPVAPAEVGTAPVLQSPGAGASFPHPLHPERRVTKARDERALRISGSPARPR